jgi:hypothetical protein
MRNTFTTQIALVGAFALLGAFLCVCSYNGALESKRLAKINQEVSVTWR